MYKIFCSFLILFFVNGNAQNNAVVSWINANAIVIEDAKADKHLVAFAQNVPQKFKDARVFGFGEASHHGKEFFDLKAKFFKYLVENQGVRVFIMEERYQSERGINAYITGDAGDKATVLKNFGQGVWYTNEVFELLQWMRKYNQGKPREDQVRFYGMDNQFGEEINTRLRDYVKKNNIAIDENLLAAADSCAAVKFGAVDKEWGKNVQLKLQQIKQVLEQNKQKLIAANALEYKDMLRGLGYLERYVVFLQGMYSQYRDRDMYENVVEILELEGASSKAFIWAHNEHINKQNLYGSNRLESLGSRLKEHFKDGYYATGFDFGTGEMKGYTTKNGQVTGAVYNKLDKPYKDTFAETLFLAQPGVYFIDMATAAKDPVASKFFGTKMKQIMLGGPGFDPEKPTFYSRKYLEAFDGLIFVKTISPAKY